ncbi:MAG: hypothetical protein IPP48_08965 [Chitinophagaceae bacterium]|nr:hypothetical protein [Chitinophagaceae bacterium]
MAFPACRNDYLFRITNTTTAPAEFFIPNPGYQLFILFRANSDGSTGNGFDISIRKIYPVSAPVTDFGMAGNGLYFNPQLGSLQTGLLYYKNPGQYSFSAGISNASSLYAAAVGNSIASGASSFATGSSKASESYATALGFSQATGYASTALGTARATNDYTIAIGSNALASGNAATAVGFNAIASGFRSFAVGYSTASGDFSTAIGTSTATGLSATALGSSSANGNYSNSIGFQNAANSFSSVAMGYNTIANGFYSTVTGTFNDTLVSSNNASPASPLFTVGNGTDNNNRSNAFVVLKNSFTGIGNVNPLAPLHIKTQGGEALRMDGASPFLSLYDNGTLKGYLQALPSAFEIGSKSSMPLDFYTSDTRRMTILPNGNVGIGESLPTAPLHITSNTVEALKIQGSSVAAAFYENTVQHGYIQSLASGLGVSSSAGQPLRLFSNQGSNERLTILANGNVGLNNSNPQTEFHVVSTGGEALRLDGPNAYQTFYNGNGYIGYLQAFNNVMSLASQGSNRLGLFSSGTERLTVMPAGNIGIDNTNPLYKLDIGGNVNFTGTINANGASGSAGQVLTSNGVAAPTWVNPTNSVYNTAVRKITTPLVTTIVNNGVFVDVPNLTHTFTLNENNLMSVQVNITTNGLYCSFCGDSDQQVILELDGAILIEANHTVSNGIKNQTIYHFLQPYHQVHTL